MSLYDIACFHLLKNVEFYTTVKLCMKHSSGIDPDLLKFQKNIISYPLWLYALFCNIQKGYTITLYKVLSGDIMDIDYKSIGRNIKEFRIKKGLTQVKLGEKSGVEPSNISHIERGATKVSLPTLVSIANALEVSLDEIVYESLTKNEHIIVNIINELLADCSASELLDISKIIKVTKDVIKGNSK